MGLFGDITKPVILKPLILKKASESRAFRCTKSDRSPSLERVVRLANTLQLR